MNNTWLKLENAYQETLAILYPKEEIKQLFLMAIESIAQVKPNNYILVRNNEVAEKEQDAMLTILKELHAGKPIQHILQEAYFYGEIYKVSEHTLIPRPETEELVHVILQDHKEQRSLRVIDVGTGTGCIPISLFKNMSAADVWAVDVSKEALSIAKENAQNLLANIQFIEADILEWDLVFDVELKFDIIVSNPPYITPKEKEQMHQNVLQYEPHLALFVTEEAPLIFYDYIADFAKAHLTENGTLYFEINQYLADETADLIRKKGFGRVEIIHDINGAARMIRAKRLKI